MKPPLAAQPPPFVGSTANGFASRRSKRLLLWILFDAVLVIFAINIWTTTARLSSSEAEQARHEALTQGFLGSHLPQGPTSPRMSLQLSNGSSLEMLPRPGMNLVVDETVERALLMQANLGMQLHGARVTSDTTGWKHVGDCLETTAPSDAPITVRLYITPKDTLGFEHEGVFYESSSAGAGRMIDTMIKDAQTIREKTAKPSTLP